MKFIKKLFGIEKVLYVSGKINDRQEIFESVLSRHRMQYEDILIQLTDLKEKVDILENETKTQDDIIFDMRKKIDRLEKPSWKGKKK